MVHIWFVFFDIRSVLSLWEQVDPIVMSSSNDWADDRVEPLGRRRHKFDGRRKLDRLCQLAKRRAWNGENPVHTPHRLLDLLWGHQPHSHGNPADDQPTSLRSNLSGPIAGHLS